MLSQTILIIGDCGSGKTWVMKELMKQFNVTGKRNYKTLHFVTNGEVNILGKYDDEENLYAGSDRLSMSVMLDVPTYYEQQVGMTTIAEGDRFTNSKFIGQAKPLIIRINDNGDKGRKLRQSDQSSKHIQSIRTRVNNISPNLVVPTSKECLEVITNILNNDTPAIQQDRAVYTQAEAQGSLF